MLLLSRHRMLADAVASALESIRQVKVTAVTGRVERAVRLLAAERVDLVLLDASLEEASSLELTGMLNDEFPAVKIVPFGVAGHDSAVSFVEAGAASCLPSEASLEDMVIAVDELHRASAPAPLPLAAKVAARIEALAGRRVAARRGAGPPVPISDRERDVLQRMARGLSNKEIAHELGIRTATVKNHVHSILEKLGVEGRREAVRVAYETTLLRGPLRWRILDDDR